MRQCCFCRRAISSGGRFFPLCPGCMDQLTRTRPELKNYDWFVRALREALRQAGVRVTR